MLAIFLKYPESGKVKTRLGKTIGNEQASQWYKVFVERTIETASTLDVPLSLWIPESTSPDLFYNWLGNEITLYTQKGSDLGQKLEHTFDTLLPLHSRVCVIGTDTPQLTRAVLKESFEKLLDYSSVIGPTEDGGYYLLGLQESTRLLGLPFKTVNWSSEQVFRQTIKHLLNYKSTHILPEMYDIDTEKELRRWQQSQL